MSLRVLLVTESSAKGTGRHVIDLAEGLLARGCEVHLLYSPIRADATFLKGLARLPALRAQKLSMRTAIHPSDLSAALQARRYLKKRGPFDLIHGHSSKGGAIARLAAFGTGVPAIYTPHGLVTMEPDLPRWKRRLYHVIEVALAQISRQVILVSPEERRTAEALGLGTHRLSMIPNGVGPARAASRVDSRRKLGLEAGDVAAGFVGRLIEYKAPDVLIEALARSRAKHPRLKVVMVGDGPMKARLQAQAAQAGLASHVIFPGERDARDLYCAFDFFVSPSRKEGLPYVILEALAAGLPIVATVTSGVELLVINGVNGSVIATDDTMALSDAMSKLAGSAELRTSQGVASLRHVKTLSQEAMVEKTIDLYRECRRTTVKPESEEALDSEAAEGPAPT